MRRTLIIAVTVLVLSALVCAGSAAIVGRAVRDAGALSAEAARLARLGNLDGARDAMAALASLWRVRERTLELMTSHDALSDVEGSIVDAAACLESGDRAEFLRAIAQVGIQLDRMHVTEAVRWANLY